MEIERKLIELLIGDGNKLTSVDHLTYVIDLVCSAY